MTRLMAIALLCILAGCRSDVTYRVLLVGDSIAAYAQPALSQKLLLSDEAGFALLNNPIGGTTVAHLQGGSQYWIERGALLLVGEPVHGVVVSLGINDALLNADPAKRVSVGDIQIAAARFMDLYGADDRPLFWVLPHTLAPDSYRLEVLSAIRSAAAGRPAVRLLDIEIVAAMRGIPFSSLLQADGVHFNDQGNSLLAEVVHATLAADAHVRGLD